MKYITSLCFIFFTTVFLQACGNSNEIKSNPVLENVKTDSVKDDNIKKKGCDTELVVKIEQNISNLKQKDILEFISNISTDCKNNVEFSEYYNEVLFQVLEKYPTMFCNCMALIEKMQQELICEELKEPVNDGINLDKIKKAVESSECQTDIKSIILNSINTALSKYN